MGKHKKKQKKKAAADSADDASLAATVDRLRQENEALRARLEKIREITHDLPGSDDEDDEYEELSRDVDDQIADGLAEKTTPNG